MVDLADDEVMAEQGQDEFAGEGVGAWARMRFQVRGSNPKPPLTKDEVSG